MGARVAAAAPAVTAAAGVTAGALMESGLPAPVQQWVFAVLGTLMAALGWLLASRRPGIVYGWLLLAAATCLGLGALGVGLAVRTELFGLSAVLSSLYCVYYGLFWIYIPLLFPDGRLPSRRWRPVAWAGGVALAVQTAATAVMPVTLYGQQNPLALPWGLVTSLASGIGQLVVFSLGLAVAVGLIVRWRRAAARGQYAWMVAGVLANLAGFLLLLSYLFGIGPPAAAMFGMLTVLAAVPSAIGVALVRYHLFDIRVGVRGSRLHVVVDVRPTVGEVLSRLGSALEDAPEPAEQLGRLAAAVRTALEVRWAAVSLADGTRVVPGAEASPAALTVQVRGGLGRLECGPREYGTLTEEDGRLLEALAVPAGLAIQSAGLAARLVNAQEAERRRLERNIHDGVQQQLVALIAGLELARATGGGTQALGRLREQARQTLADLRELAAGIHPSALSQGGLVEAVEGRCSQLPVPTKVIVSEGLRSRRFSDEVEGAMYFTVSEAVANALKHAAAGRIEVRLSHADGRLRASVRDDGKGFAAGLMPMRPVADRLDALGGGLEISQEGGTRVDAWVPADA